MEIENNTNGRQQIRLVEIVCLYFPRKRRCRGLMKIIYFVENIKLISEKVKWICTDAPIL